MVYNFFKNLRILVKRKVVKSFQAYQFIQNVNFAPVRKQKRALVSYIFQPFRHSTIDQIHTNQQECYQIIRELIERDFVVDIISCQEVEYTYLLADRHYDLILGFGEPYLFAIRKNPLAIKVFYLTETHPSVSEKKFRERVNNFRYRTGKRSVGVSRLGLYYKTDDFFGSDVCIAMNSKESSMYIIDYFDSVHLIKPTGLINPDFTFGKKDHNHTRKQFVWFGSSGAIHKGLDLVLEAVKNLPDVKLHVCGLTISEQKIFDLRQYSNVINHGRIEVNSEYFLDKIVDQCTYVILPSCSEGISTSVATCMLHGLIPIVTPEVGHDRLEFIYWIEDISPLGMTELMDGLSKKDILELEIKSEHAYNYARETFVIDNFASSLATILDKILN